MDSLFGQLLFATDSPATLAGVFGVLVLAYGIFSLMGFGSALLASAPLALVMPVARVVPLLAVLDCVGSLRRGWQARRQLDAAALRRLLPGMLAGQLLGVALLSQLPLQATAFLLGGFVALYGLRGVLGRRAPRPLPDRMAWLYGAFGGVLGGLFGSGSFVYAAFLHARLDNREADRETGRAIFRGTQGVMIAVSTSWRIVLCAFAGLIDLRLLGSALVLLPAVYLGMKIGGQIDRRLSGPTFARGLHILLMLSGAVLVWRAAG